MTRWVFVTGGVLSGLGKGLFSASLAKLCEARGLKVVPIKCDGYMNIDPGTMNPEEHGEVFVLEDGAEVDMDFGHYERFLTVEGRAEWNLTSGKVFRSIIEKERHGDFLGETVQMVPHVTDEVKDRFRSVAEESDADIVFVEIGGTVGDMENMIYLEAARQMMQEEESVLIHMTLVPYLDSVGEQKTKPTQHSVKELQRAGLSPDFIVGRSEDRLDASVREKIALFCDVEKERVVSNPDVANIYELPLLLYEQDLDANVLELLRVDGGEPAISQWRERVAALNDPDDVVSIALVGKYTDMDDTYVSIEEALRHAGAAYGVGLSISMVSSEALGDDLSRLAEFDGVVLAPGFGSRGTAGKIAAAGYCRREDIPTLGICFGMQMMVIEYARSVCGFAGAHSTEVDSETPHPVIDTMPEQDEIDAKGGTMRLGSYDAVLQEGSDVAELYGADRVSERHRHRFEVNQSYGEDIDEEGLSIIGRSVMGGLAEFVELSSHPFYIGTQAHPEFQSGLEDPHPLYMGFVEASVQDR